MIDWGLPDWYPLFIPQRRYKVLWGGRAAGRSWFFARYILLRMMLAAAKRQPIRVMCAREIQNTIRQSVHALLATQIQKLGIDECFNVEKSAIYCGDSEIFFAGLRYDPAGVKSIEDAKICWIEEAENISEDSITQLTPTIRTDNAEILISFNTRFEDDPIYKWFVATPQRECVVKKVSWRDNRFYYKNPGLEIDRLWMQENDPDRYEWVWEGGFKKHSDAQVLAGKWVVRDFTPEAGWSGPVYGVDFGFSQSPTVAVKLWEHNSILYVEKEAHGIGVELDHTKALIERVLDRPNRAIHADKARPETISFLRRNGMLIYGAEKWPGSIEDGITHLRSYRQIVIHPNCKLAAEQARLWSYKVDRVTSRVLDTLVDANNDIWDAVRYALVLRIRGASEERVAGSRTQGVYQ